MSFKTLENSSVDQLNYSGIAPTKRLENSPGQNLVIEQNASLEILKEASY